MTESVDIHVNNRTMWLNVSCGEVVGQQKWSETSVYSHGGSVSADGRHVSAPTISSVVTEKHEFWIRESGGKEVGINLSNGSFQVRQGHKIWVAWGGRKGQEAGSYLLAHNFSSGATSDLKSNWREWLYKVGLIKKPLLYRVFAIWMPVFSGIIVGLMFSLALHNIRNASYDVFDEINNFPVAMEHLNSLFYKFISIKKIEDLFAMSIVFCAGFIAGWIPSYCAANIVGYVTFLHWRDKILVKSVKSKILSECKSAIDKVNI